MVLSDSLNLGSMLNSLRTIVRPAGRVIATMPHPCFWPRYWKYEDTDWFHYQDEIIIEAPFRISLERASQFITTHIHRPLEMYVSALNAAGFNVETIEEPMPRANDADRYPERWAYPRFICLSAIRA